MRNPNSVIKVSTLVLALSVAGGALAADPGGYAGQARTFLWNPDFNDVVDTAQYR